MTYAIWEYDCFPFILCHKCKGQPDDEGRVTVPSMNVHVLPLRLVSDRRGREVEADIEKASKLYQDGQKRIQREIAGHLHLLEFMDMSLSIPRRRN